MFNIDFDQKVDGFTMFSDIFIYGIYLFLFASILGFFFWVFYNRY